MAVRFDAATETYVSSTGIPTGAFTMLCWAMIVTDRNDFSCAIALENAATNATRWYEVATSGDGTTMSFVTGGGTVAMGAMTVGTWYRLAVVANGATGTTYFGTSSGALTVTSAGIDNPTSFPPTHFFVGDDSFDEWWNGRIGNVKAWSAALTQAEIEAELLTYSPVRTTNLLRVHPLLAPSTADTSGNGNTLTGGTGASTEADPPIPRSPAPQPPTARRRAANW